KNKRAGNFPFPPQPYKSHKSGHPLGIFSWHLQILLENKDSSSREIRRGKKRKNSPRSCPNPCSSLETHGEH
uniref:Uncharacterized protein n=1 Tax=Oryza brachyantha TaxID=4533 RepID=J3MS13_ORYBR